MPRPDGTPTIQEMLGEDADPVLSAGQAVRFVDGVSWVYGVIVDPSADQEDDFNVRLDDGSIVTLGSNQLRAIESRDPDKTWPMDEDCTHCPGRQGPEGRHKFGCSVGGSRSVPYRAVRLPNGQFQVLDGPVTKKD